jgi:hypothetical protein
MRLPDTASLLSGRGQRGSATHGRTRQFALFDVLRDQGRRVSRERVEFIGLNRGHGGASPLPETFSHKV